MSADAQARGLLRVSAMGGGAVAGTAGYPHQSSGGRLGGLTGPLNGLNGRSSARRDDQDRAARRDSSGLLAGLDRARAAALAPEGVSDLSRRSVPVAQGFLFGRIRVG